MNDAPLPSTIDDYIALSPADVQPVLEKLRSVIRAAAPRATEVISYRMPAFKGRGILVYFAAFKAHIGLFPPVSGDAAIEKAIAPYAGPKGNLRFPLDQPMPYALIGRIIRLRVKQDEAKTSGRKGRADVMKGARTPAKEASSARGITSSAASADRHRAVPAKKR